MTTSASSGSHVSYIIILNLPVFTHDLLMQFELKTCHQNGCNVGLMIWKKWLQSIISNQKIMYNIDESGFAIREKEAGRCIINAQIHKKFQAKPGCQGWVSVMECICVNASVIPPLVIFRAENLS